MSNAIVQQDLEKSCWNLQEWLDYLEHRHTPEVQLRLVNAKSVADAMHVLQWSIPVITIGGTNGKGSTVAALSAIYQAAGYRVGQFTSPHLLSFNERICINQEPIADDVLTSLFMDIERGRQATPLTYFEMSLLAALLYFKRSNLDLILLEVGVGGRLDATNIIDADLAIITTVDLDHQDYLGHDIEAIGYEKAGILRPHRPCIYADKSVPNTVRHHAAQLEADLHCLGEDYQYHIVGNHLHLHQAYQSPIILPLPKLHPHAAVAAVMTSLCMQSRLPVQERAWVEGMNAMAIKGRQQWVEGDISYLYDVAHNPQAASLLAQKLADYPVTGKIHAIFSALKDKDICGLIRPLSSFVVQWYPACLSGKRATDSDILLDAFETTLGFRPQSYRDPIEASKTALQSAKPGDLIVVYGSFILVGAVMTFMQHSQSQHEEKQT
ncbi:MAG: bifunctional tetrahydrofolate synthase/dihydrofolate synthase [Legionella sp.]|nr:MAG: bifunctional tetrahydrofolate synthase/dihydrofolate synthase [Legionella sp.]